MIVDGNSNDMEQLWKDDDEDWASTERIEENSDSSDNEEASGDESVNQISVEDPEEDTTKQKDTTPKQSVRGKVKTKEYRWKRKQFEPPDVKFVECIEDSEDRLQWTPYMYFKDFVTEEMLQEIAQETNLYSV